jgi:uncharacterized membrane protein YeaQ/YmgE (transglycosylase-associated protein family)
MQALLLPFACAGWYAGITFKGFGFGLIGNVAVGIIGAVIFGAFFGAGWADFQWLGGHVLAVIGGTIGASIAGRITMAAYRSWVKIATPEDLRRWRQWPWQCAGVIAFIVVGITSFFIGVWLFMGLLMELFPRGDVFAATVIIGAFIGGGCVLLLVGGFARELMWSAKRPFKSPAKKSHHPR